MEYNGRVFKKKYKEMFHALWPWGRSRSDASITPDERDFDLSSNYRFEEHSFKSRCSENQCPDMFTKIAATNASESVVSLVTYSDDKEIFQGTGTIIDEDGTILTSAMLVTCSRSENVVAKISKVVVYMWDGKSYEAQLLAHDFYFGIAVVKIHENVPQLKPACLRRIDDRISVDPSELLNDDDTGFQLRPHSLDYTLVPGDKVIVLGREFIKPYEIMAAPGQFSVGRCNGSFECKELFRATCLISKTGEGGPLLNCHGEVIGVASFDKNCTPFIPINIALKWWKHYKDFKKLTRPLLGMDLANLYNQGLHVMEKVCQKFTTNFAGVSVQEVKQGSSADIAGICTHDIIVECCGKPVRSFLELYDIIWDNIGNSVKLVVIRARDDYATLDFMMDVVDAAQSNKRKRELSPPTL